MCGHQGRNYPPPPGLRDNHSETEEETEEGRKETITNSLVWLGRARSPRLAFLSKVFCELFQFLQVFLVDRGLRVCQRPQHVRLGETRRKCDGGRIFGAAVRPPERILTMLTTGSSSFSPGTSIHVISTALGSPGEHGVRRSSIITLGSVLEGPRT